jgi:predicted dehydrogenase/threonine dehydrogenase-like Zn-dependent dehydrogenase
MKQVFSFGNDVVVAEIPSPTVADNEVLVQNIFSVISTGTERASLKEGGKGVMGLVSKVKANPELVKKAIDEVRRVGLRKTLELIRGEAEGKLVPLGYSSSGIVLEVGRNVTDISVGDRVACAGAGYACHAEVIAVPRNLVCKIPDGVEFDEATFTSLGAIAMQGVRRAQVVLGDKVAVIGLGLIGQITCQILKASGAFVIGIDPMRERVDLARSLGADVCFVSGEDVVLQVERLTGGIGADAVIICASTTSSEPARQAMQMSRRKGRVVVVGAVGMELERSPFYEKELDFVISCSYGPGRYDPTYEEKGIDYPIGYVRWTENRNMQAFLDLLAGKKVEVKRLIDRVFPIEEASQAYDALGQEGRPVTVLFNYAAAPKPQLHRMELRPLTKVKQKVNVAVIGAGSFAQAYHLPNLKRIPFYSLRAIVTKTGANAKTLAEKYGAQYCSTDYKDVLSDGDVDLVLIATRHNLHAPLICEAAKAGKDIFVEKPIALTYEQCRDVYAAINDSGVNLTVGFNRRFAPLAQRAKVLMEEHHSPMVINLRVNSAGVPKTHWINDPVEGGGVILGEGCHFFDLISWLIGAEPRRIYAEMVSQNNAASVDAGNVVCTLSFEDGSIASLTYTTTGNESFPKERIEVFADSRVVVIDDFKELTVVGAGVKVEKLPQIQKGHFELIQEYGRLLRGESKNRDLPTVLDGIRATVCSLKALDALKTGKVQEFGYPW